MRKNKNAPLNGYFYKMDESLEGMLKTFNLENRYLQTLAITYWEKLLGPTVVSRTEKIYFRDKKMVVSVSSAALKHQLNLSKTKIINAINKELGKVIIEDLTIL
ncbi:MAG: DUF721 domain-containing protein [Cytophagales bacterium]